MRIFDLYINGIYNECVCTYVYVYLASFTELGVRFIYANTFFFFLSLFDINTLFSGTILKVKLFMAK